MAEDQWAGDFSGNQREFDNNQGLLLNYGHTFGHALESITNYKIPHGIAIAHGMNIANYISFL